MLAGRIRASAISSMSSSGGSESVEESESSSMRACWAIMDAGGQSMVRVVVEESRDVCFADSVLGNNHSLEKFTAFLTATTRQ